MADLNPSHFCLHQKALRGLPQVPSVMHRAWQSGGAAAVPGTVAEVPSGTQRLCGVLHTAGMWPWMDTQYLGRTGGEDLGVSCFR